MSDAAWTIYSVSFIIIVILIGIVVCHCVFIDCILSLVVCSSFLVCNQRISIRVCLSIGSIRLIVRVRHLYHNSRIPMFLCLILFLFYSCVYFYMIIDFFTLFTIMWWSFSCFRLNVYFCCTDYTFVRW